MPGNERYAIGHPEGIESSVKSKNPKFNNNLETRAEALSEVLAVSHSPPGVSQDQGREHRGQVDAVLAGTRVPAKRLPFAQPADTL